MTQAPGALERANATPILDRATPMPPAVALGSGVVIVAGIWLVILGALFTCAVLGIPPSFGNWARDDFIGWIRQEVETRGPATIFLETFAAVVAMLVIHECGHVLAGICAGFSYRWLRIGPLFLDRSFRPSRYRGPGAWFNGTAGVLPVTTEKLAARSAIMVLGGPLANIVTGCAALFVPPPFRFAALVFAAASILNGLSDLIPSHSRLGVSDGGRLWMLLRQRARAERWQSVMKLAADYDAGVLPEALPADFLAKATAVCDGMPDTVGAHALAYAAAFHRGDDREAARMLETCLRFSAGVPPLTREALMSDAAVFQARRRGRVDLAEQWLAELPRNTHLPWLRTRAEAAILQVRGDRTGAAKKLDELEAAIRAMPAKPQRTTSLILLERWRSELAAA